MSPVKTAVFPVAGLGSRFLPATKATPKEMLPIVDKPLIQYAVEEAIRAGIDHVIFITSSSKRTIEDHFDNHFELEARLSALANNELLKLVQATTPTDVQFTYVRQHEPLGLGHALLCAEKVVGNEPFVVLLADDLIDDRTQPCLSLMLELSGGHSVVAVQQVPWSDVHKYGIIEYKDRDQSLPEIISMIEKPEQDKSPSNFAAIGRYVFTPTIFDCLRSVEPDKKGEIQLTAGIEKLLQQETVHAFNFLGTRYDCGSKLGYLKATIAWGIQHPDIGDAFREYLLSFSNKINEKDPII